MSIEITQNSNGTLIVEREDGRGIREGYLFEWMEIDTRQNLVVECLMKGEITDEDHDWVNQEAFPEPPAAVLAFLEKKDIVAPRYS